MDVIHDLLVVPAGGKLGFAGIAHAMPMTTSPGRVAVENVRGTFRSHADSVQRRTLPRIHCVPAGTIRSCLCWRVRSCLSWRALVLARLNWPAVRGAQRLVALLAGPRFSQPRPADRCVSILPAASESLLGLSLAWPVHVVVVPV
jgi:hypothetical protein